MGLGGMGGYGSSLGLGLGPGSGLSGLNTSRSQLPQISSTSTMSYQNMSRHSIDGQTIVLAACKANEVLPMNPLYPADMFTSCLTTPIPTALRWFILQVTIGSVS
jgi:hypothetical protein